MITVAVEGISTGEEMIDKMEEAAAAAAAGVGIEAGKGSDHPKEPGVRRHLVQSLSANEGGFVLPNGTRNCQSLNILVLCRPR